MQTEIDMTAHIPRGYKNGVTRDELRMWTGMRDRALREAIKWTSANIEEIYSYDGRYFRAGSAADLPYMEAYDRIERRRTKTLQEIDKRRGSAIKQFKKEVAEC